MIKAMKSRPIKPTPILRGKHARRFWRMVERDLKTPLGLVPTPKLEEARRLIVEKMRDA